MNQHDLVILEEMAQKKYISVSFLRDKYSLVPSSTIYRRLKYLLDTKLIGRRAAYDPISCKIEYVYFLHRKGAERLMERSTLFASIDEISIAQGASQALMTHDLGISYIWWFHERDMDKVLVNYGLENISFEGRRSKIQTNQPANCIPDIVIELVEQRENLTIYIEVDNATEGVRSLRNKFSAYSQNRMRINQSMIFAVLLRRSQQRTRLMYRIAREEIGNESRVFVATLSELHKNGILPTILAKAQPGVYF